MEIESKLKKLPKDELVELIMKFATNNESIQEQLELYFATPEEQLQQSRKLIRQAISREKQRGRGIIFGLHNVNRAFEGSATVLANAWDKYHNDEYELATQLALLVVNTSVSAFNYTDDSYGTVGDLVERSIGLLEVISKDEHVQQSPELKQFVFKQIMNEEKKKIHKDWDNFQSDLLHVAAELSTDKKPRSQLEKRLEKILSEKDSDYTKAFYYKIQLKIYERNDEPERYRELLYENINNRKLRDEVITFEIEQENFDQALQLSDEADKNGWRPSERTFDSYDEYKLIVYRHTNDIENQRALLIDMLKKGRFYNVYEELKQLYDENEWENVIEKILQEMEQQSLLPRSYPSIAIEENDFARLLYYCKENPFDIQTYYAVLADHYPSEVAQLYQDLIIREADNTSDRRGYKQVCREIRKFGEVIEASVTKELIHTLKETHKRRPAFLDELAKVEKKLGFV